MMILMQRGHTDEKWGAEGYLLSVLFLSLSLILFSLAVIVSKNESSIRSQRMNPIHHSRATSSNEVYRATGSNEVYF